MTTKQVYFYSLPIDAVFTHKKNEFKKTGEEEALLIKDDSRHIFEIHWGCIVPSDKYMDSVIRSDQTTIQKQLDAYEDYISYCTLSSAEMDAEYDPATQRRSFTAWSTQWVYFPVILEGLLTIGRVPRSPCNIDINPIGGSL